MKSGPYWRDPQSCTYYGLNFKVLIAYFAGVATGIPFMTSAWFTGAFSKALGGADVSWIPGLVVTAGLYLLLARKRPVAAIPRAEDR